MKIHQVRAILAILIVGIFMAITAFMAVFPLVTPTRVALNEYSDFFAKTASVYTGIVGVVIGYYFGRSSEGTDAINKNQDSRHTKVPPQTPIDTDDTQ